MNMIKILRLSTGEDVIAKVTENTDSMVKISKSFVIIPRQAAPGQPVQLMMTPYLPFVDDEDLPEDMSYAAHNTTAQEADTEFLDTRWQYVLDQMIEAFVLIKDDDFTYGKDEEIVVQGLKMFGKYYRNLWI